MEKLECKIFTDDVKDVQQILNDKLLQYNISQIGEYAKKPVLFAYYDTNELIAGLYAYQSLGMFYIDLLWVELSYQKQGLGSQLLKKAEDYATKNRALYVRANTGSFQSPDFYLQHGYEEFAKLPLAITGQQQQYDHYFVKYF